MKLSLRKVIVVSKSSENERGISHSLNLYSVISLFVSLLRFSRIVYNGSKLRCRKKVSQWNHISFLKFIILTYTCRLTATFLVLRKNVYNETVWSSKVMAKQTIWRLGHKMLTMSWIDMINTGRKYNIFQFGTISISTKLRDFVDVCKSLCGNLIYTNYMGDEGKILFFIIGKSGKIYRVM